MAPCYLINQQANYEIKNKGNWELGIGNWEFGNW